MFRNMSLKLKLAVRSLKFEKQKYQTFSSLTDAGAGLSESLMEDIRIYAKKRQTDISLRTLLDTGQGKHLHLFSKMYKDSDAKTDTEKVQIQVANFLHRELPVR